MRRRDREVTAPEKIRQIMDACPSCRLGLVDDGIPYVVPMNFGLTEEQGRYTLYFHSAREGRKIDVLRKTPRVAFEMDTNYQLNEGIRACDWSARFQCVMGSGTVRFLETPEEKRYALEQIMAHSAGRGEWTFSEEACQAVCIFCLDVESLSCKEHE